MSFYTDSVDNHAVHTNLENVQDEIAFVAALTGKPTEDTEALARITLVIKNFRSALETCEKNFIVLSWLNEASSALVNIKNALISYKSNREAKHLKSSCFVQLDALLQCTVKLNCVRSKQNLTGFTSASGRPSVDQVVLFKSVMIQHLFGILSLRRTMEEINVNVAYRCIQASISYSAIRACVQPKLFLIGFSFGQIKSFRISSEGPFIAPLSFVET